MVDPVYGLILVIGFIVLISTGMPIAFAACAVSFIFSFAFMGKPGLMIGLYSVWNTMNSFVLIAIPFFILMGSILQKSGVAEEMFESISAWTSGVRGGLAIGTVIVCTIFAAMSGVIGASIVTMSLVALPSMLYRQYSKDLAMGTIMASGSLAMLIPPSILFILYGMVAGESIGKLYLGGVIPGLLLATSYIIYIAVRCWLQPSLAPQVDPSIPFVKRLASLHSAIGPLIIISLVLGSMFLGIATASEAAALGAVGSMLLAAMKRRLTVDVLKTACYDTAKASVMVGWVVFGAGFFTQIFTVSGIMNTVERFVIEASLSPWAIIFVTQIILLIAGCLIDDVAIIMLLAPFFVTMIKASTSFDPLWFGVIFNINLQLSLLTPPFGFALFYMRGMAPAGTNMGDVYRSAIPFIIIQFIILLITLFYPPVCTWLPNLIIN